jgi:hypothetical protein
MRTISAEFSAEFIAWVTRSKTLGTDEFDFYDAAEFHIARAVRKRMADPGQQRRAMANLRRQSIGAGEGGS